LELYGQNREADAVRCWQEVLVLAPGEQRALDFLESAGVTPAPVSGSVALRSREKGSSPPSPFPDLEDVGATEVDREVLVGLLRDKRYEEALVFLYRERERRPEDASLTRGIHAIKDHLTAAYARQLGSLDQTPRVVALEGLHTLSSEQRQVLRLLDGLATYGDILRSSRLGRFETYRLLALLAKDGRIAVRATSVAGMPAVRPPMPTLPSETGAPTLRASSAVVSAPPVAEPAPLTPPPPSITLMPPSVAPNSAAAATADPYTRLFEDATRAYLRRDYDEAERLFERCAAQRPGDRRAEYNLRKLKERKGSS
jgi:hypothetical protein